MVGCCLCGVRADSGHSRREPDTGELRRQSVRNGVPCDELGYWCVSHGHHMARDSGGHTADRPRYRSAGSDHGARLCALGSGNLGSPLGSSPCNHRTHLPQRFYPHSSGWRVPRRERSTCDAPGYFPGFAFQRSGTWERPYSARCCENEKCCASRICGYDGGLY